MPVKKKTHFDCKKLKQYMAYTTCLKNQDADKAFFKGRAEMRGACSPSCEQGKKIAEMINGKLPKVRKR